MCIWITKTRLHSGTLPFSLSVFSYTLGLGLPLYSGLLSAKPHTLPCDRQCPKHSPSFRRQSSRPTSISASNGFGTLLTISLLPCCRYRFALPFLLLAILHRIIDIISYRRQITELLVVDSLHSRQRQGALNVISSFAIGPYQSTSC